MKNAFKTLAVALTALALVSCGGTEVTSADLVGSWKADPSSLDLTLGDGIPAEFKTMIESGKKEAMSEATNETEGMLIEFTKDGKIVLSKDGEEAPFTLNYVVEGDKLSIKGEVEGEKLDYHVTLTEASADKFTITLTAEDLLSQIKEEMPEAMNQVPGEFDVDAMAKGTSVSMSFKK